MLALGNGYLGIRGCAEEGGQNAENGTFINGFYESRPITYGEEAYRFPKTGQAMLHVTDSKIIRLFVDDETFWLPNANFLSYDRRRLGVGTGYCIMIGGEKELVRKLDPIFATLAPGIGNVPRTPGREKLGGTAEQGYLHCGSSGAGHFVKMIHNGIEYGIMAAYAEGIGVLKAADAGKSQSEIDAETTPLRDPQHYQYDFNLADISEVWRRGSVIASWLLDLTAAALAADAQLAKFGGRVSDSGEGRWTIKAAIDEGVPVPVLTTALYERFSSRGEADYADRLLSAMRFGFGGHLEKSAT